MRASSKRPLTALLLPLPVLLLGACAGARAVPEDVAALPPLERNNLEDGLALEGYDPVAYFPEGGGVPARGKAELTAVHEGVTYRFASEADRERFLADPERYLPAYGGWCAYAMADGQEVEVDPESFLIQDGRLLLFYDGLLADTRAKWLAEGPEALAARADAHWGE